MNFLKKLFLKLDAFDAKPTSDEPKIRFGRYSDSFKNEDQINHWENALQLFKEKDMLNAYEKFFNYLLDKDEENVIVDRTDDSINFKLYQGSKKVIGTATKEKVCAYVKLVKFNKSNVAFMRMLMEKNYELRYSRFGIEDDIVYLKFNTTAVDGSPEKLYYALKEVAIQADKIDDLLIEEFSVIEPIDTSHIIPYPDKKLNTKIVWLRKFINTALQDVNELSAATNDGDITYILLSTTFKIDYFITPEGKVMDLIEKLLREYYERKDGKNTQEKNARMIEILKQILEFTDEQLKAELYKTKATFGLGTPTSHRVINKFMDDFSTDVLSKSVELKNSKLLKYQSEYLIGFILYYYGIYKPTIRYLEFVLKLLNPEFYTDLGFKTKFIKQDVLEKNAIKSKINYINKSFGGAFEEINVNANAINYESMDKFLIDYINEIKNLAYPN